MSTFTWAVAPNATLKCKPTVESTKNGEGYEQRTSIGINSKPRKWSVRVNKNVAAALNFLETHNGEKSFMWTDPLGVTSMYLCREWTCNHVGADIFDISCDFEQVFE